MSNIQARAPTEAVIPKYVQPKTILSLDGPSDLKDFFPSHITSYVQPKTLLLYCKSIVFGWTYELICEGNKSLLFLFVYVYVFFGGGICTHARKQRPIENIKVRTNLFF